MREGRVRTSASLLENTDPTTRMGVEDKTAPPLPAWALHEWNALFTSSSAIVPATSSAASSLDAATPTPPSPASWVESTSTAPPPPSAAVVQLVNVDERTAARAARSAPPPPLAEEFANVVSVMSADSAQMEPPSAADLQLANEEPAETVTAAALARQPPSCVSHTGARNSPPRRAKKKVAKTSLNVAAWWLRARGGARTAPETPPRKALDSTTAGRKHGAALHRGRAILEAGGASYPSCAGAEEGTSPALCGGRTAERGCRNERYPSSQKREEARAARRPRRMGARHTVSEVLFANRVRRTFEVKVAKTAPPS